MVRRILGWLFTSAQGPLLLKLNLGLGLFLMTLPAAFWGGYRLLHLVGLAS